MAASNILHRTIKGEPYTLTPIESEVQHGYHVTRNVKPSYHFARHYIVLTNEQGQPTSCSCPQGHYKQAVCKHMKCVEEMYYEQHPEALEARQQAIEDELVRAGYYDQY